MSQTVYTNTKATIYMDDKPLAAAGGEGTVYRVISTSAYTNSCVKIYHPPKRTPARRNKIEFMIKNKPNVLSSSSYVICWPTEMVFDNNGNFLGFLMSLAFTGSESLYELTRTKTPKQLQQQWSKFDRSLQSGIEKRLRICVNIAIAVHSIHQSGKYTIVDYKPQNILITNDGKISITDVDSFQIANNGVVIFHSEVATPEYAPPESARINPSKSMIADSWDRFSFAVSFYEILFGIHPFAASSDGQYHAATTIGDKIQNGLFVHGSKKNYLTVIPSIHNNFKHLPTSLIQLFIKAFDEGHTNDKARPTAEQWGNTIYAELTTKTGIKANSIASPQQNVSPPSSLNKTPIASNTSTYTRPYVQTTPQAKTKTNHTTILVWLFIAIVSVAIFALYYNKTAKNTITNTTPSTISTVNRTGYISAKEFANIRTGPSTKYGIITKKYRGELVYVLEKDLATNWYKVRYSGSENVGYIANELISFDALKSDQQQPSTNTTNSNSSNNSNTSNNSSVNSNTNDNSSNYSNTNNNKIHSLNGKWVKIGGSSDRGIVVSYSNNIGTIVSVTNNTSRYYIGEIEWKNYDPERNNLQFLVHLSDGYLNTPVKFIHSDTIQLSNSGDVYARQRTNMSSSSVNTELVREINSIGKPTFQSKQRTNMSSSSVTTEPVREIHSISEPTIQSKETKSNRYGTGKGMASFWTDKKVVYKLSIDGNVQSYIRQYFSGGEPVCGQDGTVTINLSEGKHSFIAKVNEDKYEDDIYYSPTDDEVWKGTFYVVAGQCINIKVNKR